jgi:hypothetical protein
VPLISAKEGEQLEERARKHLPQLKEDFRAYAEQMHASRRPNGWANLSAGRTERYVDCFVPMVEDVVPPCLLANGNQAEDPELVVWNLIEGAVNASLDVPTDPWMPAELFSNIEFRVAMLAMIKRKIEQLREPIERANSERETPNPQLDNGPRPELEKDDFLLRTPIIELFEHLNRLGDGRIAVIEVRYGLPFRLTVEQPASGGSL